MAGTINLIAGETGYPFVLTPPKGVDLTQLVAGGVVLLVTDPNGVEDVYPLTVGNAPMVMNNVGYSAFTYVWIPAVSDGQFSLPGRWKRQLFLYLNDGTVSKGKQVRFDIDESLAPPSGYIPSADAADEEDVLTSTIATLTVVAAAPATTQILGANTLRKSISIFNDSSATLYLAASNLASATTYSTQIPPGELFESSVNYQGPYSAVWVSATGAPSGNARITEYQ